MRIEVHQVEEVEVDLAFEEIDNHSVNLDDFELGEVPDVPLLDLLLEIRELEQRLTLPCKD